MGKLVRSSTPLLFKSKLLCFSILYLFSSLFYAFYTSISSTTKCHFRSSSSISDPIQSSLFNYPRSYGQHKHSIPTFHSHCNSPVFFNDYSFVLNDFRRIEENSSWDSDGLRYIKGTENGNGGSFGTNYLTKKRISYFDHRDVQTEIPCGFLKKFPISDHDKIAMERCKVVIVSAIFGDHDKIRQPKGLGYKTLDHACFYMFVDDVTLKQFYNHNLLSRKTKEKNTIGVWRIVKVNTQQLYENPAMNVIAKDVDMAISKHPIYVHTMEEAMATARWKKWGDVDALRIQIETYCENGLQPWSSKKHPYPSDVPDSAIILRKHGVTSNLFSCLLFNELEAFNPRDQLPFAFVRDKMNPKMKLNMFDVEVFEHVASEYRHNIKHHGSVEAQPARTKRASPGLLANGSSRTKCDRYLEEMWGETRD
uniref:probable hexosyltransferase MUCI70 isoform X2 n=1 Tax=Erigeron canadensis TaxID=72917 RepID=UPI001CB9CCEB|nr:probable hexosyltransferase MUCI70 isoform X2 [Erigeron canadensis]